MTTRHEIQRGDTWEKTFTISQGGAALDLSGLANAWMTFRESEAVPGTDTDDSGAALQVTLGAGIVIADAVNGVLQVTLTAAQTRQLSAARYVWDLQLKLSDGRIKTADRGPAEISGEVTVSV